MTASISQFYWLTGGFFFGMFFMYHLMPLHAGSHNSRLNKRDTTTDPNGILKFGNPGPIVDLFERQAYTTSFNRKDRIPYWVGEHLTAQGIVAGDGVNRDKSKFTDDQAVPALFRASTNDYTNSGFDRGHMAPAGDATATQSGLDQTFLMTNISPQVGVGFNRQYWAYLEKFCRDLTGNFTDVFVYTGPLFLPQLSSDSSQFAFADAKIQFGKEGITKVSTKAATKENYKMQYTVIGKDTPNVAVPTHFYKILLTVKDNKYNLGAFVLPNQAIDNKTPLKSFQVDLLAIEKASGLQFFNKLDRSTFANLCTSITCTI